MNFDTTATHSRALAVGLLVLAIGVGYFTLVRPYWDTYAGYRQRLELLDGRLARARQLIGRRGELGERLARLRSGPGYTGYYLPQATPALASAALQNRVRRAVTASGGRFVSTQTVAGTAASEGLVPVTVKVNIKGTIETLLPLFHALEGGEPLLFLDNVSLRGASGGRIHIRRPSAVSPMLDIRFDLTGYIHPRQDQGA